MGPISLSFTENAFMASLVLCLATSALTVNRHVY